ncbi:MAG: GNAT family protein [Thermoplasmata archaeon]
MSAEGFRTPIRLTGRFIELLPLSLEHAPDLAWAFRDPEVTRLLRTRIGPTVEDLEEVIQGQLASQAAGTDLPFTTTLRSTGRPIGLTRYLRIDRASRGVEIGGTVLDSAFWRTPVNTESKWLLLRHAFEVEGVHRVQIQTDLRNTRSQRAIERLGAVPEARLRDDVLLWSDAFRTSVYYSILDREWPAVRARLESMLARSWSPPPASTGPKVVPRRETGSGTPVPLPSRRPPLAFAGPLELTGRWVRLIPLRREHAPALAGALADPSVWTYLRIRHGDTPENMAALVEDNLALQTAGDTLPFTVLAGADEMPVGVIRYLDIHRDDQWVEIGTWLGPAAWRTPVNTEAKYLLLRHAFESEGAHRVQLKTDSRNLRSQRAILRLGAVPEGAIREHYRFPSGDYRTSLYYSILESEWPAVRHQLEAWVARPFDGTLRPRDLP